MSIDLYYDDRYFRYETTDDGKEKTNTVAVFGDVVKIDDDFDIGTKHLIVRGYEVQLAKGVRLAGRNVGIYCRRLVCTGTPHIDVSGVELSAASAAAKSGTTPGAAGIAGGDGNRGTDAGAIVIVAEQMIGDLHLSANGGRGQDGQDGGNGAPGKIGENGKDGVPGAWRPNDVVKIKDGEPGQDGTRGGDAGAGGAGGAGGNAGAILVRVASAPGKAQLRIDAAPGEGGKGGQSGAPGSGGQGGTGGLLLDISTKCYDGGEDPIHGKIPGVYTTAKRSKRRAPNGNPGSSGSTKPSGKPGAEGASRYGKVGALHYDACLQVTPVSAMRPALVLAQLRMAVFAAEQAYLTEDFAKADEILDWGHRLLSAPGDLGSDTLAHDPARAVGDADDRMALAISLRVGALREQRARGLDYFGMAADYVPHVSRKQWSAEVERSLTSLEAAENAFDAYKKTYKEVQGKQDACRKAMAALEKALDLLEGELADLRLLIERTDALIGQLVAAEVTCAAEVESAAEDVRSAVEAFNRQKGSRCTLEATLKIAGMIASVATGAYGAFVAFSSALVLAKESQPATPDALGTLRYLRGVAGKVEEGIDGVQAAVSAYDELAKELEGKPLLIMTEDQVDAILDEYKHLPEAQAYRALLDELMAKVRAKNGAIVARDSMATRFNAALSEREARRLEHDALKNQLAATNNPVLVGDALFMGRVVDEAKRDCQWLLRMEHRSLEFWRLAPTPFSMNTANAATLRATHERLRSTVNRELEKRTSAEQPFKTTKKPIRWTKDGADGGWVVRTLIERGATTLRIHTGDMALEGFWGTVVEKVEISIHGVRVAKDILQVRLTHLGDGRSYDGMGQIVTHTYRPRTVRTEYDVVTGEIYTPGVLVDSDDGHAQLSPYGTWTLEVPSSVNEGLDLSGVEAIELRFEGYRRAL